MPFFALIWLAAAAQPAPAATVPPPPPGGSHRFGRYFISPMGEPFATERGGDALATWFAQADRDHDGRVLIGEMKADADRFFALLDVNHDGEIDPDEISRYETVIVPAGGFNFAAGGGAMPPRRPRNDPINALQGRARYGLLDLREPVAAADTNFNRGVSVEEFRVAAERRFTALDVDHRGVLTLDVLESLRPPPPLREKKDPDAPQALDANSDTSPN